MSKQVIATTLLVLLAADASAYKPARPKSHTTTSPDGRHIFVMLSSDPIDEELQHWNEQMVPGVRALREKWSKSGMYRNDGSAEPLWTVDWYAYVVSVPSGGEYVVRYNAGGWSWQGQPALAFYRRGELVRSYEIDELVTVPALIEHGDWLGRWGLDDGSMTVRVTTETEDRCVFDVRTGEMVSRFRPIRYAVTAAIVVVVLSAVWFIRQRQRMRATLAGPVTQPSRST
jgi:hypothetical protein